MKPALYGMPSEEDFKSGEFFIMGCLMDIDLVDYGCPDCGTQILQSGAVINPSKGIF
jgi:hypothetical protein